jgi:hypothetical protein
VSDTLRSPVLGSMLQNSRLFVLGSNWKNINNHHSKSYYYNIMVMSIGLTKRKNFGGILNGAIRLSGQFCPTHKNSSPWPFFVWCFAN